MRDKQYDKEYKKTPRSRYCDHKAQAKRRGIPWEFTFNTWWSMWQPHWDNRGATGGGLCMCRYGDAGPYSPSNCRIDTMANNVKEAKLFGVMGNNTSGITGVRWHAGKGRWVSSIQVDGKRVQHQFQTLLDAAAWRLSRLAQEGEK